MHIVSVSDLVSEIHGLHVSFLLSEEMNGHGDKIHNSSCAIIILIIYNYVGLRAKLNCL